MTENMAIEIATGCLMIMGGFVASVLILAGGFFLVLNYVVKENEKARKP